MEDLTLKELIKAKEELQNSISDSISKFQLKTEVEVTSIDIVIERDTYWHNSLIAVKINLDV